MKFPKVLSLIMAVCLLGSLLIACDNGGKTKETETSASTTATVSITLVIKNDESEVNKSTVNCDGTLADAIEMYCAGEGFEGECFDASTGMLTAIGDLKAEGGKNWVAYYEDEGISKAFKSIKEQTVENGKTVVLVLK